MMNLSTFISVFNQQDMNRNYQFQQVVFSVPDGFKVRMYGKAELALLYFPQAANSVNARRMLMRMLVRCKECYRMLCSMGYQRGLHTFTPMMVACIVHYCGVPPD